ncbi:hypothetical protein A8F94_09195 [Bacillus sp. FJAT-27225]|uniref:hypothetical protein n=1 Tax=Bacillus sp. FJAT-27225 TaxID=1743144 RepID=UPI00080C20B4|nr:hypothetical protein [Bacillus sp. FJAT-27225]OCA87993.1 hypothetical protein A8F94_09195 [Bacillus sp. FJAT-27225]
MLPFLFPKGGLPKWLGENYLNNDIQKYVHDMIEKSMSTAMSQKSMIEEAVAQEPETKQESGSYPMTASIFESHEHVYVRLFIEDEKVLANLKIYHNTNQLMIEGLPGAVEKTVFTLPSLVKMKDTVSEYKDQYLQIKMKKRQDPQMTEVAVPIVE